MFYTFNQNNTGGNFVYDYDSGLSRFVIIEADTRPDAIEKALEIGIYFDGTYNDGPDCPCCGDRWYRPWDEDTEPMIYNRPASEFDADDRPFGRWIDGYEGFIHYKDGRKVGFGGVDGPGYEEGIPEKTKGIVKGKVVDEKPVRRRRKPKSD